MPRYSLEYITNLKYDDLKDMDKNKLLQLSRQASSYANTRRKGTISAIRRNNLPTPHALSEDSLDKYSTIITGNANNELGHNELIHNILLSKQFLLTKTSTLGGWKEVLNKGIKIIEDITDIKINKKDYSYFYEVVNRVNEVINDNILNERYGVYRYVAEAINDIEYIHYDAKELATYLINKIENDLIHGDNEEDNEFDRKYQLGSKKNF